MKPAQLTTTARRSDVGKRPCKSLAAPHAILRTSWVFSETGSNFVKTMLRLGSERDSLTIVADQIGGPTAADDIARALLTMAQAFASGTGVSGIYHFAGAPDCSWADFACEIFDQAGVSCDVTGIATSDYPTAAARPRNSRLDCTDLETVVGITRPDWRQSLSRVLKDLT